jgi:glycosyltransferase involved in cell wall biosynthesis
MPLDADFLGAHHTLRKEPLVAMIGRLDRLKAPEVLLQSLSILRDEVPGLRAVLVGHGNPTESPDGADYLVWIKKRAADLGLDVELPGRVPRHEVRELCRRARVVAVPSRFETFSMAAAEALACGTPAIVTTRCGIADWLEGAYPGAVIPADDAVALADALRTPLMDEREALRRGELGRAVIAQRCDPRVIARERISIYRELGLA